MTGVACGIWPMRGRRLVAVLVDESGRPSPPLVFERSDGACWGLLEHLDGHAGLDYALVVPDWLAKSDGVARLALARGIAVWVAPTALAEAVCAVAGAGPPRRAAAVIARLPLTAFRGQLRRVEPADRRQLTLL